MSYLPHMRPSPAHQVPASGPCTGGKVVLTPNLHHVVVGALPGEYHCGACNMVFTLALCLDNSGVGGAVIAHSRKIFLDIFG